MLDAAADAFWDFSLAFYRRPEIAAACLSLQEREGRDVNLVLYLCWIGLSGRGRLAAADLARADAEIAPWRQDGIEPLRAARRALAGGEGALAAARYAAAKAAELDAERVAQRRLAALAPPPGPHSAAAAADAAANLALYLGGDGSEWAAPIFAALAAIGGEDGATA